MQWPTVEKKMDERRFAAKGSTERGCGRLRIPVVYSCYWFFVTDSYQVLIDPYKCFNFFSFNSQVTQMMPGQTTWQEQCQDFPITRQEWDTVTEMQTVTREVDECLPTTTPDCHTYEVPSYEVEEKPQTDDVTVNIPTCQTSKEVVEVLKRFTFF